MQEVGQRRSTTPGDTQGCGELEPRREQRPRRRRYEPKDGRGRAKQEARAESNAWSNYRVAEEARTEETKPRNSYRDHGFKDKIISYA